MRRCAASPRRPSSRARPRPSLDALLSELTRALPPGAAVLLEPSAPDAADVVATARTREDGGRLLVPVAFGGDVHHVAALTRPGEWSPEAVMLAETLANQAALGLARLDSERRRTAQDGRDKALARAAHALNVSHALQEVLDTLAREADAAVAGSVAGLYLVDEDGTGHRHRRAPDARGVVRRPPRARRGRRGPRPGHRRSPRSSRRRSTSPRSRRCPGCGRSRPSRCARAASCAAC